MKHVYLFTLLFVCAIGLSACDEKEKGCGEEVVAGRTIYNANDFAACYTDDLLVGGVDEGIAIYRTSYQNFNGRAHYTLRVELENVCRSEPPFMSVQTDFTVHDSAIADTMFFGTPDLSVYVKFPAPHIGSGIYDRNEYMAIPDGDGGATIILVNVISFPTQGSREADSLYFFGNLIKQEVGINARRAE
jgi:hypothetical protein